MVMRRQAEAMEVVVRRQAGAMGVVVRRQTGAMGVARRQAGAMGVVVRRDRQRELLEPILPRHRKEEGTDREISRELEARIPIGL